MASDDSDAPAIRTLLRGFSQDHAEYVVDLRDRPDPGSTPIDDWEEEGAWDDLDVSELEDDLDDED